MKPIGSAIRTFTGVLFDFADPQSISVNVVDIAHSLSLMCRFAGHVKKFYSIAEHAVRGSYLCTPGNRFWFLNHDDSEAYYVDVPRPLKYLAGMDNYKALEKAGQRVVCRAFGLPPDEPEEVKYWDSVMLVTEQRDLLNNAIPDFDIKPLPYKIKPWSSRKAEKLFLMRFKELSGADLTLYERARLWFLRRELEVKI